MHEDGDIEAEHAADRIVACLRERASRLPLRASFVEALGREARPAVHALLFALATERASDPASLEHHETMAMLALLGRSFALEGTTPTAAAGVVPAILEAFRDEGFAVPSELDAPLGLVFLEGFVRGREERLRADLAKQALEHVVLIEPLPRIGIVVIRGDHDAELLASHLEALAREAFARELAACVLDVSLGGDAGEGGSPVLHFASLIASVGVHVIFVGPSADAWAEALGAESRPTTARAVDRALEHARLIVRDDRAFGIPLRGLLKARALRKT